MHGEQQDGHNGLLDEDLDPDYNLYREMNKESRQPHGNGGCFSMPVLMPLAYTALRYVFNCIP